MTTSTINLLPKEEKKRDIKSVILNVFMVIMIILLIAVIFLSVFIFDIDNTLSSRLGEYENVNMKIQDQVNKLEAYNSFNNDVEEKKIIIECLQKDEIVWSKILYDIGRLMPEGAYIKIFDGQGRTLYSFLE